MDSKLRSSAVIIPAFNAAETLPGLFARLWRFVERKQVVLVDDGSSDGTAEISSKEGVQVFRHQTNLGKGKALQTGFDASLHMDSAFAVTMDADLQHAPEDLPSFFEAQTITGADVLVGMRRRRGTRMPLHRVLSNTVSSRLVSWRTGQDIKDSQCGYRLMKRSVVERLSLESSGYEAETEFLIKAAKEGFRIEFVPIETIYSNEGSSMRNWETTVKFVKVLLREY
ncbi:MAG TPA: glycosyltransferase family 2 protein [Bacteroidota bacterium]|nr:glycosyltransferase family 2 protein [Bacteroidota bacterium]